MSGLDVDLSRTSCIGRKVRDLGVERWGFVKEEIESLVGRFGETIRREAQMR